VQEHKIEIAPAETAIDGLDFDPFLRWKLRLGDIYQFRRFNRPLEKHPVAQKGFKAFGRNELGRVDAELQCSHMASTRRAAVPPGAD
jgi:hypothetical protein